MNLLKRCLYEIRRTWDALGDNHEIYSAEDITYFYVIGEEIAKENPDRITIRRHLNAMSRQNSPIYRQVREEYLDRFIK